MYVCVVVYVYPICISSYCLLDDYVHGKILYLRFCLLKCT